MPAGREAEFKAGFSKFYDATKVDFAIWAKFSGFAEFSKFYEFYDATKLEFSMSTKFSGFNEFSKIYYIYHQRDL